MKFTLFELNFLMSNKVLSFIIIKTKKIMFYILFSIQIPFFTCFFVRSFKTGIEVIFYYFFKCENLITMKIWMN
jgi:hypothetical protein